MAIDKVREFFRNYGIEDRVIEFDVSSATVDLAAAALGCEGARIAKSMASLLTVGKTPGYAARCYYCSLCRRHKGR